jgi:hypothetical protein
VDGVIAWPRARELAAVGGHGYGIEVVCLFLQLVLVVNVSLRGAARVLGTMGQALGLPLAAPSWTTGRLWLLRLGHAMLTASLEQAPDWAWLIDHSVQVGTDKCLVILGIRLVDLPPPGQSLRHQDLRLIALMPASSWTRPEVDQALEKAALRTGVPRVIVDDHGVDINGGVALFQQRHPQTVEIYDAKHKAACLLKHRLEKNPRWQEFQSQVGQTRCAVQQTELAFLMPPGPKPKARFMNLGPLLAWAGRILAILRQPPPSVQQKVRPERLQEKLGWIENFASDVKQWLQWQQVVDVAVTLVNQQGLAQGTAQMLAEQLSQLDDLGDSAKALGAELVEFVRGQQEQARPGERFPGSTEILESCFGKFKQLEKQHSRGGFTQLLLGFGALLARTTRTTIQKAMQQSRTADVRDWAQQTLGTTLFAQRKLAYAGATENGCSL